MPINVDLAGQFKRKRSESTHKPSDIPADNFNTVKTASIDLVGGISTTSKSETKEKK